MAVVPLRKWKCKKLGAKENGCLAQRRVRGNCHASVLRQHSKNTYTF